MTSNKKEKSPKQPRISVTEESDEFIYAVCESFFREMAPRDDQNGNDASKPSKRPKGAATAVAESLAKEFNRSDLTREKIYPLLWEALRRRFLIMNAPVENDLRRQLIEKFDLDAHVNETKGDVAVVNVVGKNASQHVSATAADRIIKLIFQVQKEKEAKAIAEGKDPKDVRVHLGLGAGYAAMVLADRLSTRATVETPKLTLHALTPGGFYIAEQQNSPTAYFLRFTDKFVDVECLGMFSPPVVTTEFHSQLRRNPSLFSSYNRREEIDILVTSLASATDPHGLVRQYFEYLKTNGFIEEDVVQTLENEGWVGDVLFQPYSASRPIYPKSLRTVALFELDELVKFSKTPGKHVVVIGAPCNVCRTTKANALLPLLREPSLRLWTQLIIDREAVNQLLTM